MIEEAALEELDSGLAPTTDGWFVVNVRDAAWLTNDAFGARCVFEANGPVIRRRSDLTVQQFDGLGFTLQVVQPGQASGLYHAESNQENLLVLAGECLLLIEGEERPLRAWDFVHCPPGTAHAFAGTGKRPVHHLHDGLTDQGQGHRLSPLRAGPPPRRGRRDGDEIALRGVRALSALAA